MLNDGVGALHGDDLVVEIFVFEETKLFAESQVRHVGGEAGRPADFYDFERLSDSGRSKERNAASNRECDPQLGQ